MKVYAVILAGGKGERLWPVSTPERPKPFLPLGGGGRSLLRATYERVLPVVGESQVFVVVDREHASLVQTELGLAEENIIIEPQGKNTAPAIGLAAAILQTRDPKSVTIVLPSDHLIGEEDRFRQALRIANLSNISVLLGKNFPYGTPIPHIRPFHIDWNHYYALCALHHPVVHRYGFHLGP